MNEEVIQEKKTLREEDAKVYNRIKVKLSIVDLIINIVFITLLAFSGISRFLVEIIEPYSPNLYLQFLVFLTTVGMAGGIIGFPLEFYSSYILEHRFKLSNQSFLKWIIERAKSLLVGLALGIPVALAFYYFLRVTGGLWWVYFSIFLFLVSILLARLAPVLIFPIFYTFKPMENSEIGEKILTIIQKYKIQIKGIFSFNMSKETKKANAGFTGIGKSKRIILSDTLIENFSPDEIAVIFAHEVGHYRRRHIVKNIFLSGIVIFISFYICGQVYDWSLYKFGFSNVYDIAAIPILFFYLSLFSLLTMPLTNFISRKYEIEADDFSIKATGDRGSFISGMEKLAEINLADKEPNPIVEFLFYGHPSIKKRIDRVEKM